jgi:glycosyltransferase involved in cell wall biosynthesis
MHLGLVIYGSLDTLSGGYLYDRKLVEHLRGQGDEVTVVSLPWRNYAAHLADNFSPSLTRHLRAAPFDLLLQDELNHPSLFWLNGRLRREVAYPIVSIVHHLRCSEPRAGWMNRLYRAVERRYLGSVDGYVFNSHTTRGVVESLVGTDKPSVVAYPAADHLDFGAPVRAENADGPLRLAFVANLIPRKGLHTLLDALARLEPGSWRLAVIGSDEADPAYARAIRRQIERLGLAAGVTLTGALPSAGVAGHLAASDVLAVPSAYEGFGIVYLEAMGHGLPALACTTGAAHEIVTDGETGFLVAPGDAEGLADAIRLLAADRARLAAMGRAARRRFEAFPTWAEGGRAIRAFAQEMVARRRT